ncbi:dopamine beta-hydroxylase-like [Pecten maximus]|uniref:dopamine beta-hydroxylase-like n=1 Tax=Pecten maximus TaxID=6579 RepID=UPI001458DA6D|nr:dopamine beta-hydroxylase-like [Pecten maximus]
MKTLLSSLVFAVIVVCYVHAYPSFQTSIPNGGSVLDPCDDTTAWPGIGHEAMGGSGPLNPFGRDLKNNGKVWNLTLCEMDSDGDGISNGAELGDPDCEWTPGSNPAGQPTGHPGMCEPWSDPVCLQKNAFHICETENMTCDVINSPDVQDFAIRFPKTAVPKQDTTYMCMNFALPADQDYHVIADRGLIDNKFVMHHIILYACPYDVELDDLGNELNSPYVCGMAGEVQCVDVIGGWSVGMPGFCHNGDAGIKIGPNGHKYVVMQMHWNNPLGRSDYTDSSGMTLFYTPILRPYNLGNLMTGEHIFRIPPGENRYVVESECSSTCSARLMSSSIYIISGFNHMHYMGRKMTTYHTPAGGVEQAILHDPSFSYDNPVIHTFPTPLEIKPGDVLRTKCSFTSSSKVLTTTSGEATSQEMCYTFLFYYPKESFQGSDCTTAMGLPVCLMDHDTELIDGCQLKSFFENRTYIGEIFTELAKRCEAFNCRKECKAYIKELRQNPCFQGKVKGYVDHVFSRNLYVNETALYHSCDADLELEAIGTCNCTPPCVDYTGTSSSHQLSLFLLVAMTTMYFLFT